MAASDKAFAGFIILAMCFVVGILTLIPTPSDEQFAVNFAHDLLFPEKEDHGRMAWVRMTDRLNCGLTIYNDSDKPAFKVRVIDCPNFYKLATSKLEASQKR
jgi:hypothetical protein